jgi:hypothetical protein
VFHATLFLIRRRVLITNQAEKTMSKMWSTEMEGRASQVREKLKRDRRLGKYIDTSLEIPQPYRGQGEIRLIVLGQDPTVKDAEKRKDIQTVLNLDKSRSVRAYVAAVCNDLGIKVSENVYATNLYKNFFVRPPTQIAEIDIFQECVGAWLPLLMDELAEFPKVPLITLGEPILAPLLCDDVPAKVRHYWGYVPHWETQPLLPFHYIKAQENKLARVIFPFPHQPSLRKKFYHTKMKEYVAFVRTTAFS